VAEAMQCPMPAEGLCSEEACYHAFLLRRMNLGNLARLIEAPA
jgi:hypothetical protein